VAWYPCDRCCHRDDCARGEQLRTAGHDRLAVRNRTVTVQRRVVVLSRGGRLAGFATHTLGNGNGHTLACLESPAELADWSRPAVDVVLLDFPRRSRGIVYRQLRQRYRGPVLALLDPGEDGGLPASQGPLAILNRPFSGGELSAVLDVLLDPPPETAEPPPPPPPPEAPPPPPPAPAPRKDAPPPAPAAAVAPRARRSRMRRLARRGLRRWEIVAGATALVLLGLSLGGHGGCQSSCVGIGGAAGAAERNPTGRQANLGLRLDPGGLTDPQPGSELVVPPTLAAPQPATGGRAAASMGVGSLVSHLAAAAVAPPGATGQPLLVSPAAGTTGGGSLTTGSAPPAPPPAGSPPPPRPSGGTTPPATKPPATSPPTTSPPATSPPPTVPPTTAPPVTTPVTQPPTTVPSPPTAPPTPTTEIPPPTTN
jgi:hypothetical protein